MKMAPNAGWREYVESGGGVVISMGATLYARALSLVASWLNTHKGDQPTQLSCHSVRYDTLSIMAPDSLGLLTK